MKRATGFLLFVVMVVSLFSAGCGKGEPLPDTAFTITDMMGRESAFEAPVTRVVALTPADCEILYAIGAGELLVGRGTYCDYPAEVLEKTEVASGADTNIEAILALNPQVVLMSTMDQTEAQVAALEEAGVRCVVSAAQDIEGVYAAITMIGQLVGRQAEAAGLIDTMKATFDTVRMGANAGKTVYFEVSPLEWGLWTAGSGTFMDEIAEMVGLTNIFSDVEGWAEISEEQVLERNPDYIVTITMYFGEGPTPEAEIMSRTGWQNITAVQNGAVYNADSNEISRPGPRLGAAAEALADFVYQQQEESAA